jgi:exodeoxyribonuclease VII large subunit
VIAGVGHETDFTIVDFVADLRAPTPSAAAELATPNISDFQLDLNQQIIMLTTLMNDHLGDLRHNLTASQRALGHLSPVRQVATLRQRLDDWTERLERAQKQRFANLRERLNTRTAALNAANPEAILARGYAIVTHSDSGKRVTMDAQAGDGITIQLHDGELKARIEDKEHHEQYRRTLF